MVKLDITPGYELGIEDSNSSESTNIINIQW